MERASRSPLLAPSVPLLLAALLLAACGGGGTSDGLPAGSTKAELTGEVLSIDGLTSALDGVVLSLRETGDVAVTATDGWFSFGEVPTGTLTVDLVLSPTYALKTGADASTTAGADDAGGPGSDDNAAHEGEMQMSRVREQERIHVRLRIQDGAIGEMECVRAENTERETERQMLRTAANGDPDMEGEIEVAEDAEGLRFCVRVQQAEPGRDLEAEVAAPNGATEGLGPRTVDADGTCRWEIRTAAGGTLPFGAAGLEALEGYRVRVRAAVGGDVLLEGDVPALPGPVDEARRKQLRLEERTQERVVDSDGLHDRDQDRDQDRTQDDLGGDA